MLYKTEWQVSRDTWIGTEVKGNDRDLTKGILMYLHKVGEKGHEKSF